MIAAGPSSGASAGIVALHGRGASAAGMLDLIAASGLPGLALRAPEAPGNSWWPTSFLAPSAAMEPYAAKGIATASEAVAALEAEGLPRGRIWLLGFSQGACLALETYARAGEGLAGVFAFSGGLVGTGDAEGGPDPALYGNAPKRFGYTGRREGGRAWLSVREQDPHIPLRRVLESAQALRAMGAAVETDIRPGPGHSVERADIARLRAWLNPAAI
jgi:predicted esterase